MAISIRPASAADAAALSAILIASITELCAADHNDDPQAIAQWTRNKSPDGVTAWLQRPDLRMFLAFDGDAPAGVGAIDDAGAITLNYVAPAHRYRGVSKALLRFMERELRAAGVDVARLVSTATAHELYQHAGWIDAGPPVRGFSVVGYPMRKRI